MMRAAGEPRRSLTTSDDDVTVNAETRGLINTLYINLILFALFMVFFEANRHLKLIYLKRLTKKLQQSNRVPPCPSSYPFAWVFSVLDVSGDELLRMVGLDGYMLIRYIIVCFRVTMFFSFWGVLVLVPIYGGAKGSQGAWAKFTLANIPNDPTANQLWVPVVFAYFFSYYFCHAMYDEYKHFIKKRVQYLICGDPDTPPQTYYTIIVEKIPLSLRSAPALEAFFEKLFPDDVYSVEVCLDLADLDALILKRRGIRDRLEKSIALWKATGKRPTMWVRKGFYDNLPATVEANHYPQPLDDPSLLAVIFGYEEYDAIDHLTEALRRINEDVQLLQIAAFQQRQKVDEQAFEHQQHIRGKLGVHVTNAAGKLVLKTAEIFGRTSGRDGSAALLAAPGTGTATGTFNRNRSNSSSSGGGGGGGADHRDVEESKLEPLLQGDNLRPMRAAAAATATAGESSMISSSSLVGERTLFHRKSSSITGGIAEITTTTADTTMVKNPIVARTLKQDFLYEDDEAPKNRPHLLYQQHDEKTEIENDKEKEKGKELLSHGSIGFINGEGGGGREAGGLSVRIPPRSRGSPSPLSSSRSSTPSFTPVVSRGVVTPLQLPGAVPNQEGRRTTSRPPTPTLADTTFRSSDSRSSTASNAAAGGSTAAGGTATTGGGGRAIPRSILSTARKPSERTSLRRAGATDRKVRLGAAEYGSNGPVRSLGGGEKDLERGSEDQDSRSSSSAAHTTTGTTAGSRSSSNKRGSRHQGSSSEQSAATAWQALLAFGGRVGGIIAGLARESVKTAVRAGRGALHSTLEAIRAIELLTVGAYYQMSSTAFVTFQSRVAKCSSHQMLLSHDVYSMNVKSAPNPKDVIWDNVPIPLEQINMRRTISAFTMYIGAIFWSIVVGFISAVSNLESLSKEFPWLEAYRNTQVYQLLNEYLAAGLLLVLLNLLPTIFDFIARSYEGLKLESEIQNAIMSRYFYYQLANVFVSVGLGSLATGLHQIIDNPSSILRILGSTLPSFSVYFTTLLIVKTFTAIPLELLRVWPLIEILTVQSCTDKKKCTIRELKSGAFADPQMLYGWAYPSLLMVLMIVSTYCCIAPMLLPFAVIFYAFAYLMYKYQLLYVYINDYQSGGFMWYAAFNSSMVALLCGILTLLGYLGIRETFITGPFYVLAPLPLCIIYFWFHTDRKFKAPSMSLSLESAIDLDQERYFKSDEELPHNTFKPTLFRQPALVEGPLKPQQYRQNPHRQHKAPGKSPRDILSAQKSGSQQNSFRRAGRSSSLSMTSPYYNGLSPSRVAAGGGGCEEGIPSFSSYYATYATPDPLTFANTRDLSFRSLGGEIDLDDYEDSDDEIDVQVYEILQYGEEGLGGDVIDEAVSGRTADNNNSSPILNDELTATGYRENEEYDERSPILEGSTASQEDEVLFAAHNTLEYGATADTAAGNAPADSSKFESKA